MKVSTTVNIVKYLSSLKAHSGTNSRVEGPSLLFFAHELPLILHLHLLVVQINAVVGVRLNRM